MPDIFWDPVDVFNELRAGGLPRLSGTSRKFYEDDPEGWSVSRKRQLEAALCCMDREQFTSILREFASVFGKDQAIAFCIAIWEKLPKPN